jgi:hypothetical protein
MGQFHGEQSKAYIVLFYLRHKDVKISQSIAKQAKLKHFNGECKYTL